MRKDNVVVVFSSHHTKEENEIFKNHIKDTIGCEHKIVCYENHNQFGLTELYNKAKKEHNTKNGIMVYCHNDIIFKTKNWGRILLTKFNSTNFSIIGVAGSTYMGVEGIWWKPKENMVGIVEHTDGDNVWVNEYSAELKGKTTNVLLIDGLFMAVDWSSVILDFNEDYDGFHFYDVTFSIENWFGGCDIGVTTDIRILHKSVGAVNESWDNSRKKFIEEYNDDLPISC